MKTLQSNFTTPKQSKRLLELGVPADSADCYYEMSIVPIVNILPSVILFSQMHQYIGDDKGEFDFLPCWSVGRLMEIIDICVTNEQSDPLTEEYPTTIAIMDRLHISYVEFLVRSIAIAKAAEVIDYSKLDGNK